MSITILSTKSKMTCFTVHAYTTRSGFPIPVLIFVCLFGIEKTRFLLEIFHMKQGQSATNMNLNMEYNHLKSIYDIIVKKRKKGRKKKFPTSGIEPEASM